MAATEPMFNGPIGARAGGILRIDSEAIISDMSVLGLPRRQPEIFDVLLTDIDGRLVCTSEDDVNPAEWLKYVRIAEIPQEANVILWRDGHELVLTVRNTIMPGEILVLCFDEVVKEEILQLPQILTRPRVRWSCRCGKTGRSNFSLRMHTRLKAGKSVWAIVATGMRRAIWQRWLYGPDGTAEAA